MMGKGSSSLSFWDGNFEKGRYSGRYMLNFGGVCYDVAQVACLHLMEDGNVASDDAMVEAELNADPESRVFDMKVPWSKSVIPQVPAGDLVGEFPANIAFKSDSLNPFWTKKDHHFFIIIHFTGPFLDDSWESPLDHFLGNLLKII